MNDGGNNFDKSAPLHLARAVTWLLIFGSVLVFWGSVGLWILHSVR